MDDLRNQVESLRRRQRLQNILSIGVLMILMFAMGGADTVARTLVEADAWKVRTKNIAGTLTDRITVTTDADTARIKISNANLELAQQASAPSSPTEGSVWYDSTAHKLKYRNNTTWIEVGSGGGGGGGGVGGVAGVAGRLEIPTPAGSTTLDFKQYCGDVVEVNGQLVQIGTGKSLTTATLLIDGAGANAGSVQINTTYCVYLSNSQANPNPSSLRLANATLYPPQAYNGVKYLGTSGNAANWRFLGWVRTYGSTFVDTEAMRFVINYYNRRPLKLALVTSNNSYVNYYLMNWTHWLNQVHAVEFIANGEDLVYLYFSCFSGATAGTYGGAGIGLDWTSSNPVNDASVNTSAFSYYYGYNAAIYNSIPSAGPHTLNLLMRGNNSSPTYWYGRDGTTHVRPGAAGYVMG